MLMISSICGLLAPSALFCRAHSASAGEGGGGALDEAEAVAEAETVEFGLGDVAEACNGEKSEATRDSRDGSAAGVVGEDA